MTENSELQPMTLPVHDIYGRRTGGTVELDPRLFGLPRNDHVLYLAVKAELANRRQGTHSTKGRSDVRGGGRKPFRQKGRGAARAGTSRSPIWRGGGKIFGPQPHDHKLDLPKKVKRLARCIALSVKAHSDAIILVEDFDYETPKTKSIAELLGAFEADNRSVLLMVEGHKPNVVKSCRNIPRLVVRNGTDSSTYDILNAAQVIICRSALDSLVKGLVK